MPSEEWFRENPKVSAYISRELHQKLETWMEDNGVKKVSQALTEILEAFLEPSKADDQQDALMALERKFEDRFAALESRVTTINLAIAEMQSSPKVVQPDDKRQLSLDDIERPKVETPKQPKQDTEKDTAPLASTDESTEVSSPLVDQSSEGEKMRHGEVSKLLKTPENTIRYWHRKKNIVGKLGYQITPIHNPGRGKPAWIVQKVDQPNLPVASTSQNPLDSEQTDQTADPSESEPS